MLVSAHTEGTAWNIHARPEVVELTSLSALSQPHQRNPLEHQRSSRRMRATSIASRTLSRRHACSS